MLSILIPIYNFNCKPLLKSLHSQAEAIGSDYSLELMYNRRKEVNYVKNKIFTIFNYIIDMHLFEKVTFNEDTPIKEAPTPVLLNTH